MNLVVVTVAAATIAFLWRPALRDSETWRATVTPLASIVGSGFLVVAPLLGSTVGPWSVLAMVGIVALAYAVGGALRYDIAHVEERIEGGAGSGGGSRVDAALRWLGRASKGALALAYVVAVAFYLELLGAFVLRPFAIEDPTWQKALASLCVVGIGSLGTWRGLRMLESLERYAVDLKLGVIAAFLVALALYNGDLLARGAWSLPDMDTRWNPDTLRKLLGAFLIVQGFETSRYLRGAYPPALRIRTMRYAQWISAAIYVLFVGLATVLVDTLRTVRETAIIDLSDRVAGALPSLLIAGAVMSQLSAAVADTIGSGGLVEEASAGRVPRRRVYAFVATGALVLLWSIDIFSVIAWASRAFALYYALQCTMAALHAASGLDGDRRPLRAAGFAVLAAAMTLTALYGLPAESADA